MTQPNNLKTPDAFPAQTRLAFAKNIKARLWDEVFEELDAQMPDVEMSMEEIQSEINAQRIEEKQKNKAGT